MKFIKGFGIISIIFVWLNQKGKGSFYSGSWFLILNGKNRQREGDFFSFHPYEFAFLYII